MFRVRGICINSVELIPGPTVAQEEPLLTLSFHWFVPTNDPVMFGTQAFETTPAGLVAAQYLTGEGSYEEYVNEGTTKCQVHYVPGFAGPPYTIEVDRLTPDNHTLLAKATFVFTPSASQVTSPSQVTAPPPH